MSKGDMAKFNDPAVRALNNVVYEIPTNYSLVQRRQLRENFAERQEYPDTAREIQIRLTASSDFVCGRNSYLTFDIEATLTGATHTYGFPDGITACNLFSRMLLEDQSGAELERIQDLNEWCASVLPYHWSADFRRQAELAGGYDTGAPANYSVTDGAGNPSKLRVCIPMWWISGVFGSHTLLPPTLTAGMLLRLTLDTPARALCRLSGAGPDTITASTYTISNCRLVTDCVTLVPYVQRSIQEKGQAGLPFAYTTLFRDQFAVQAGGDKTFNVQINKAVARACSVDHVMQDASGAAASFDNVDTRGIPANVREVQARVGDLYVSNQPIRTGSSSADADVKKNSAEIVNYSYWCMRKTDSFTKPGEFSLSQYQTAHTVPNAVGAGLNAGRSLICHNLEQSPSVKDSGISINNSRVCELQVSTSDGNTNAQTCKTWLRYVKTAYSFPARAVIKE